MAERDDTEVRPPAAAIPLSPREEAIVNGAAVTFAWEPVADATAYYLEVAEDTGFQEVVLEKTVSGGTSVTVDEVFAQDGRTYYWRVFAHNVAGESHGDLVESFISTSPQTARNAEEQHMAHPDAEEDLGPVPELFEAISDEVAAEVQEDEDPYAIAAKIGVQHEGIGVAQVLGFILAILVVIGMAVVFTFYLMTGTVQEKRALTAASLNYPELREVEAAATQRLTQYDVAPDGTYRIPIDRAIDLMVNEAYQQPDASYSPELRLRRSE